MDSEHLNSRATVTPWLVSQHHTPSEVTLFYKGCVVSIISSDVSSWVCLFGGGELALLFNLKVEFKGTRRKEMPSGAKTAHLDSGSDRDHR